MKTVLCFGHCLALFVLGSSPSVFADEGLEIDHLTICQGRFFNWSGVGDGREHNFGEMAFDWHITGGTIMISHRFKTKYQGETFSYDLTGKSRDVTVVDAKATNYSDAWKIVDTKEGTAIVAKEGALKGYYLQPGKEDIKLPDQTRKLFIVGKQPILAKEPYYFRFVQVSP